MVVVTRKIPSRYTECRKEGVVCCQDISHVFQGEGYGSLTSITVQVFVIKELPFSYKARKMEGDMEMFNL